MKRSSPDSKFGTFTPRKKFIIPPGIILYSYSTGTNPRIHDEFELFSTNMNRIFYEIISRLWSYSTINIFVYKTTGSISCDTDELNENNIINYNRMIFNKFPKIKKVFESLDKENEIGKEYFIEKKYDDSLEFLFTVSIDIDEILFYFSNAKLPIFENILSKINTLDTYAILGILKTYENFRQFLETVHRIDLGRDVEMAEDTNVNITHPDSMNVDHGKPTRRKSTRRKSTRRKSLRRKA